MPTTPQRAAGWRIEPPVSVPRESGAMAAATAAAEPPLEPPGRARDPTGCASGREPSSPSRSPWRTRPCSSLPSSTAASASQRRTTVAVYGGRSPWRTRERPPWSGRRRCRAGPGAVVLSTRPVLVRSRRRGPRRRTSARRRRATTLTSPAIPSMTSIAPSGRGNAQRLEAIDERVERVGEQERQEERDEDAAQQVRERRARARRARKIDLPAEARPGLLRRPRHRPSHAAQVGESVLRA